MNCECGAALTPVEGSFLGLRVVTVPKRCGACRRSRSERMDRQEAAARASIREEVAALPRAVQVWPEFQPVVDEAWALLAARGFVWAIGGPGDGKTTLCAAVVKLSLASGGTGRYEPFARLCERPDESAKDLWRSVDLLAINTALEGRARPHDHWLDQFEQLLRHRSDNGLKTLVTSVRDTRGIAAWADEDLAKSIDVLAGRSGWLWLPPGGGR